MEGWICPRCKKCLAPWVKECDCFLQINYDIPGNPYVPDFPGPPKTGDPLPTPSVTTCDITLPVREG